MSLPKAVGKLNQLEKKHMRILKRIEDRLNRYKWVPVEVLAKDMGIKPKHIGKFTEFLEELEVITKQESGYEGYTLTLFGLDTLALHDLGLKGMIEGVGPQLDVGKEGDIYVAYLEGESRILKLYRMRRKTFQRVGDSRPYSTPRKGKKWTIASYRSAAREFKALKQLWDAGVKVPQPIERNRHVIEMNYFDGFELVKAQLQNPKAVFREVIREVVKMVDAGIVHGELSAYNLMVNKAGDICFIDFPQYVSSDDPRASKMLRKDFNRLIYHFTHKYSLSEQELLSIVQKILDEEEILPSSQRSSQKPKT